MKAHKYWSLGLCICMLLCLYTGSATKSKEAHKYCALGATACMLMAIYTGHTMVSGKRKQKAQQAEAEED